MNNHGYKMSTKQVKQAKRLEERGWKHDGLWWWSPYTGTRYLVKEALAIEELRGWAASESAILGDKDHSMWVLAEQRDNALISMEELSKRSHERKVLRDRSTRSNFTGEGTS
jgi:hypothetical protein